MRIASLMSLAYLLVISMASSERRTTLVAIGYDCRCFWDLYVTGCNREMGVCYGV
jgi:hypothetical protein